MGKDRYLLPLMANFGDACDIAGRTRHPREASSNSRRCVLRVGCVFPCRSNRWDSRLRNWHGQWFSSMGCIYFEYAYGSVIACHCNQVTRPDTSRCPRDIIDHRGISGQLDHFVKLVITFIWLDCTEDFDQVHGGNSKRQSFRVKACDNSIIAWPFRLMERHSKSWFRASRMLAKRIHGVNFLPHTQGLGFRWFKQAKQSIACDQDEPDFMFDGFKIKRYVGDMIAG